MVATTSNVTNRKGGHYLVKEDGLQLEFASLLSSPSSTTTLATERQQQPQSENEHNEGTNDNDGNDDYLVQFRNDFQMNVLNEPDELTLVLELINVDVSFVNALRRIILSEIPTVAIEQVYMWNNTSIIHDEVLSHRFGLIPIALDARYLDDIHTPATNNSNNNDPDQQQGEWTEQQDATTQEEFVPTDRNTVVFRLSVSCPNAPPPANDAARSRSQSLDVPTNDTDDIVVQPNHEMEAAAMETTIFSTSSTTTTTTAANHNSNNNSEQLNNSNHRVVIGRDGVQYGSDRPYTKHVYSSDLIYVPQGDQLEILPQPIRPMYDDILIAKLRPGQCIECELHACKGIGKDHAKFSPVATTSYRLMPSIQIIQPIYDKDAEELVYVYEPGVFDLIDTDPMIDPPNTTKKARLINPYACTMSRNYMRHPILSQCIQMQRLQNHYIFTIESVGLPYRPGILFAEALRILQQKCTNVIDQINSMTK